MKLIKRYLLGGSLYNAGSLPEIIVTPTNDQNWLFQKGKYKRNARPFIDNNTKQYVIDYLSLFDNENAPEYNARIKRLSDALEMHYMGIKNLDKDNHRAYYVPTVATMYVENMDNIFAELAHPWQYAFGNNDWKKERAEDYNADKDPRGGTRYAYPDTIEGETHAFFEPALKEYIETGSIGKSSPIISKKKSKIKITPKDIREVADSAASWDKLAINKRLIVNYSQLPLLKRVKFALTDFPLLDEVNKHKDGGIINKYLIGGYVLPQNVQESISNGSASAGLLQGFGRVMEKILPTWILKAGTYVSPLNYVTAISKGSINPKVGEEEIATWHPNLLLLARLGEAVGGGKVLKSTGNAAINTAAKAGNKTARGYIISKELNKGILNKYNREPIYVSSSPWEAPDLVEYPDYVRMRGEKLKRVAPDKILDYAPDINNPLDLFMIQEEGFHPMYKMTPGANLKALLNENIRRLKAIYGDSFTDVLLMKQKGSAPYYLGYFDELGVSGLHNVKRNLNMIELNPYSKLHTDMMHEGIMHGTDNFLTDYTASLYLNFIDKIINSPEIQYKNGVPHYKWLGINTRPIPGGTEKWYEGRSTFGELRKAMYDNIAKNKNTKVTEDTFELLRPEFEKQVDNMSLEDASKALIRTNPYGDVYGNVGPKVNPNFLSEFKGLLKYAPISIPFITDKKKKGGKLCLIKRK